MFHYLWHQFHLVVRLPRPRFHSISRMKASFLNLARQSSVLTPSTENVTITANRSMAKKVGKQKSQECVVTFFFTRSFVNFLKRDIRLLAVSTHMTELSYAISDIQTRIFGMFAPLTRFTTI